MNLKQIAGRVRQMVDRPEDSSEPAGARRVFKWDALEAGIHALRTPKPPQQGRPAGAEARTEIKGEARPAPVSEPVLRVPSRPEARPPEPDRSSRGRSAADNTEAAGRAVRWKVPATVPDLTTIYKEVGIESPLHGYGVDKLAEMLDSPHLASASHEVRASTVLVALEAARVPLRDVIDDALLRSKALDAFEADKALDLQALKMRAERRAQVLRDQVEALRRQKNGEIEELRRSMEAAEQSLAQLRARKRREEERLHRVVTTFVEPRPAVAPPAPVPAPARSAAPAPPVPPTVEAIGGPIKPGLGASAPTAGPVTRPAPLAPEPASTAKAPSSPAASSPPTSGPAAPSGTPGAEPAKPAASSTSSKTGPA